MFRHTNGVRLNENLIMSARDLQKGLNRGTEHQTSIQEYLFPLVADRPRRLSADLSPIVTPSILAHTRYTTADSILEQATF
jgi:hypothetical protein